MAVIGLAAATAAPAATAPGASTPRAAATAPPTCQCDAFDAEVERLHAVFESRGAGVAIPLDARAHAIFATRINQTYLMARCLLACDPALDRDLNPVRRLLAASAYKAREIGLAADEVAERLDAARTEMERCLELEPADPECLTWHASVGGRLEQSSWNPMVLLALARSLLAEFRAARGDLAPGHDLRDGAATRGEASILLRAPRMLGGNPTAARLLMETALQAPRFICGVSNRILLAAARTRTGDHARGLAELRATVGAGLPSCALQRYENAAALAEATRCLARIDADPALVETWPDVCE